MKSSFRIVRLIALTTCVAASLVQGQQPGQVAPATPAQTAPATPPQQASTAPLQPLPSDQISQPLPYEHWDVDVFYWLTSIRPSLRGGAAALAYENLDYPGNGQYTPGLSISFPVSRTTMLNFSGFIGKGASNTTASQAVALFGTIYGAGDYLASTYKIDNFKLSLQDLFFPFPRKENQKWRIKTLWELQYDNISTNVNAPLAPTTDSEGNPIDNEVTGSRYVVYPTFGLAGEYHFTKNVALRVNGSGFAIPHHSTIGDAQGTISDRIGQFELIAGYKYYHFKTSVQNDEYFKTTLDGAYAALRWYPEKFSVPCPFCRRGSTATAKNDGSNAPAAGENPAPGQTALATGASSSSSSAAPPEVNAIRRISGGLTLSVLGFNLIPNKTATIDDSSSVSTEYQTQGASSRFGYGLTGQVALTDHFALVAEGLYRPMGYQLTTTVTTSTAVNGVTTTTTTSAHEDTRARLIDVPAMLRFYNEGRHTPGAVRYFLEGGGAIRDAATVRTSLDSTDSSGVLTCCITNTPTRPLHKIVEGAVAGAGLVLIDPLGIHVIPEVRYTRWMNSTFDAFTTDTSRNEIAAGVSLSF